MTQDKPKVGETVQACPESEQDEEAQQAIKKTFRFKVFFDGTLNNKTNVTMGTHDQDGNQVQDDESSYGAEHSNIAQLSEFEKKDSGFDYVFSHYIEGIGTDDGEDDHNIKGAGLGKGSTGVTKKAEKAFKKMIIDVTEQIEGANEKIEMETIVIDVFGFSRGAAAARYFIHIIMDERSGGLFSDKPKTFAQTLTDMEFTVNKVEINFVGLFDTVASYGIRHSNDTAELSLDCLAHAKKVVQLAAADEHRANFRLTNINSAGGKGNQIFLPGVHSDVGGGYNQTMNENNLDLMVLRRRESNSHPNLADSKWDSTIEQRLREEGTRLIDAGWYHTDELEIVKKKRSFRLRANRDDISNNYSVIALRLMVKLAHDSADGSFTALTFDEPWITAQLSLQPELERLESVINAGAMNKTLSLAYWDRFNKDEQNKHYMRDIRHQYFHFSANYNGIISPHKPQFSDGAMSGIRQRIIQDG